MVSLILLNSGDVYVTVADRVLETNHAHISVGIAGVAQSQYQIA